MHDPMHTDSVSLFVQAVQDLFSIPIEFQLHSAYAYLIISIYVWWYQL